VPMKIALPRESSVSSVANAIRVPPCVASASNGPKMYWRFARLRHSARHPCTEVYILLQIHYRGRPCHASR
jgi:hypothetical protein